MARRHIENQLSHQESSVRGVWRWYRFQSDLINAEEKRAVGGDLSEGFVAPPQYRGFSRDEIAALISTQKVELDFAAMLQLLAATEAALRVDFIHRVAIKKRDAVSREFGKLHKEHGKKHGLLVKLKEQLLEVHKQDASPEAQQAISDFVGALKIRHWLAHGRYWRPKFGQRYDPDGVFEICRELIEALGLE